MVRTLPPQDREAARQEWLRDLEVQNRELQERKKPRAGRNMGRDESISSTYQTSPSRKEHQYANEPVFQPQPATVQRVPYSVPPPIKENRPEPAEFGDFFWDRRVGGGSGAPLRDKQGNINTSRRRPSSSNCQQNFQPAEQLQQQSLPANFVPALAEPFVSQLESTAGLQGHGRLRTTFGASDPDAAFRQNATMEWRACLDVQIAEKKARDLASHRIDDESSGVPRRDKRVSAPQVNKVASATTLQQWDYPPKYSQYGTPDETPKIISRRSSALQTQGAHARPRTEVMERRPDIKKGQTSHSAPHHYKARVSPSSFSMISSRLPRRPAERKISSSLGNRLLEDLGKIAQAVDNMLSSTSIPAQSTESPPKVPRPKCDEPTNFEAGKYLGKTESVKRVTPPTAKSASTSTPSVPPTIITKSQPNLARGASTRRAEERVTTTKVVKRPERRTLGIENIASSFNAPHGSRVSAIIKESRELDTSPSPNPITKPDSLAPETSGRSKVSAMERLNESMPTNSRPHRRHASLETKLETSPANAASTEPGRYEISVWTSQDKSLAAWLSTLRTTSPPPNVHASYPNLPTKSKPPPVNSNDRSLAEAVSQLRNFDMMLQREDRRLLDSCD
ncbi:hypothetical protein DFS34DRAFT_611416 [Phlyctochytrium arcticum]|nr:hypothetical protein DFS34DRAFT_611416 [Phlyctochytrium arcticum]